MFIFLIILGISELLLYVLWKEVLTKETKTDLSILEDWPLLPVVSAGRRLLISPEFVVHLLEVSATSFQVRNGVHTAVCCVCAFV